MVIDRYELNDPDYKEKEKANKKEVQFEEEEEAPKKTPRTSKYVQRNHSKEKIIKDKRKCVLTMRKAIKEEVSLCLLFYFEPKTVIEACKDEHCMKAMEELLNIKKNRTWELVLRCANNNII